MELRGSETERKLWEAFAGERTEQFRREMLTAHAQTLAKAGNKAGKETPYEGAY